MDSVQQVERASRKKGRKQAKTPSRSTRPPSEPEERDYVAVADRYAQRAIADTEGREFGRLFRLAASRYIKDRKACKDRSAPYTFVAEKALDACSFIEKLPHVEGKWETSTVLMHDSHIFFVVNLFGFRNPDGNRRFTTALLALARKNAKSWLAAAILLYCLCCEDENGAQAITAATTGSQARIVFNIAKKMVEKLPDLREAFNLEVFSNSIAAYSIGGMMKPINAKASTQDGLNPSHTVFDEIHAHKSHDLLNVLQSAAGARANPLWLFTTTEGYETPGPWPEMRHFCYQLLNGVMKAEHFLAVIFAVDEQIGQPGEPDFKPADEDFDPAVWRKANPLMEVNPILRREIEKGAAEAKQMPGRHAEFRIKRLNRQSSVAHGWTNLTKWRACSGEVDTLRLSKHACWGGLDLSTTSDLTSFRLVWDLEGVLYTKGWRWVPKIAINKRKERGLIPYQGWVESGHLIQAGDDIIDYDEVVKVIVRAKRDFNLQSVAYDDWNAKQILNKLTDAGVPMQQFIQGPKSFHPAMKLVEERYITGKLAHGGDPVLAWCASNLIARKDVNLNTAPDKSRSLEKIDDMVALFMAAGASGALMEKVPEKKFQLLFV